MFWKKKEPKYWIVRRSFIGTQVEKCVRPDMRYEGARGSILEGPFNTREEAIEAFKFWTTNKHDFGGIL